LYKQTTRLRRFAARDRALTGWRRPYPGAEDGSILHALTEARQAFAEGVEKARPVHAHVADYLGLLVKESMVSLEVIEQAAPQTLVVAS